MAFTDEDFHEDCQPNVAEVIGANRTGVRFNSDCGFIYYCWHKEMY